MTKKNCDTCAFSTFSPSLFAFDYLLNFFLTTCVSAWCVVRNSTIKTTVWVQLTASRNLAQILFRRLYNRRTFPRGSFGPGPVKWGNYRRQPISIEDVYIGNQRKDLFSFPSGNYTVAEDNPPLNWWSSGWKIWPRVNPHSPPLHWQSRLKSGLFQI